MAAQDVAIYALNRGLISQLALARTDLKRMALSASIQTNLMPRILGSAMLRCGFQYIGATYNNQQPKFLPFVFSTTDVLLIENTPNLARFWIPDSSGLPDTLLTRVAVSSAITNGTFSGSLSGWTNADQAGALSEWVSGNFMYLEGNGYSAALEYQQVTVASGDVGKEHALRIVIDLGTITLNIGTALGDGTYAFNLLLTQGTHSIAFTPTGNFTVQISNILYVRALVTSIEVEGAGTLTLPTPWGASVLSLLRADQSGDVLYVCAGAGVQQQKILRWGQTPATGSHSFSIVVYQPNDGPFQTENVSPTTITPSSNAGNISLVSSSSLFVPGHVGMLVRLASVGQQVNIASGGEYQWSAAIEVVGSGTSRNFVIIITGTFSGTVVLQQSVSAPGAWVDVGTVTPGTSGIPTAANWTGVGNTSTWTAPVNGTVYDGFDNYTIYYRIGFEATYTSGVANCGLGITSGSTTGIVRISNYISSTEVGGDVLLQAGNTGVLAGLGAAVATQQWWFGIWSPGAGFASAVAFQEGRLWWAGVGYLIGSVSNAFESYDDTNTTDSGPIIQQFGSGPVDSINWLLGVADLIVGAPAAEKTARSSVLGGVITPTDFVMKDCGTQGSAPVAALKIDFNGVFLQRSQRRIYLLTYTPSFFLMDYQASDLTNFVPDIAIMENGVPLSSPGFNLLAVQRQPDTRIHALLNDGTVRVCVFDPAEDEHCWVKVQTSGNVVDIVVLPGQGGASSAEDLVYYVVNRTINGQSVYYLERWAREDECIGQAISKCADSHLYGTNGSPSTTISLPHLVGASVVVWGDGINQGTYTVSSGGTVTLNTAVTNWCAGLGYTWQFQSTKLAYAVQSGTMLNKKKRINSLGIITANMAYQAFQYGNSFSNMQNLPNTYKGGPVTAGQYFTQWDDEQFAFPGTWDADARLCLQGSAPNAVHILGVTMDLEMR